MGLETGEFNLGVGFTAGVPPPSQFTDHTVSRSYFIFRSVQAGGSPGPTGGVVLPGERRRDRRLAS